MSNLYFALDLPCPPSKNASHGYGRGRVYRSKEYTDWIERADGIFMAKGFNRGRKPIDGKFDCTIFYSEHRINIDPQNMIDCAVDWLEHAGIISNDKNLRAFSLMPGDIGDDVRVIVWEAA